MQPLQLILQRAEEPARRDGELLVIQVADANPKPPVVGMQYGTISAHEQ